MSLIYSKLAPSFAEDDNIPIISARGNKTKYLPLSVLRAKFDTVPSGTPVNAVAANGVVTFSGTPVADETLTVGSDVYTFKASRSGPFEITINANNTTQGDNLVTALTADTTEVTASNSSGAVTITAATKGTVGNSIVLSESATGTAVTGVTGGKLDGGVDGTVGEALELRVDSSYLYVATATNTIADANWRRIALGSVY